MKYALYWIQIFSKYIFFQINILFILFKEKGLKSSFET